MLFDYCRQYGISTRSFPSVAGFYKGRRIIVCGDAACIWEDLAAFSCRYENKVYKDGWDFMTVNGLVSVFPGIVAHAYSNNATVLRRWVNARRDDYVGEFGGPLACHSISDGHCYKWPWIGHGTSGQGGVLTAMALGYSEIVLAGMPLDSSPHNGEPPWRKTGVYKEIDAQAESDWKLIASTTSPYSVGLLFQPTKISSMSGRTREWFGEP